MIEGPQRGVSSTAGHRSPSTTSTMSGFMCSAVRPPVGSTWTEGHLSHRVSIVSDLGNVGFDPTLDLASQGGSAGRQAGGEEAQPIPTSDQAKCVSVEVRRPQPMVTTPIQSRKQLEQAAKRVSTKPTPINSTDKPAPKPPNPGPPKYDLGSPGRM